MPTVVEAVSDANLSGVLRQVLDREVMPFVALPRDDLESFAADVLRRFANPYIQHRWHDISLNGLSKFRARNLDRMLAYQDRFGAPPPILSLSLAAWLLFYLGRFDGAAAFPPRDSAEVLARMAVIAKGDTTEKLVEGFLSEAPSGAGRLRHPCWFRRWSRDVDFLTGASHPRRHPSPDGSGA